jgi:hypothetical protein
VRFFKFIFALTAFLFLAQISASSVRLLNDSPYRLRAVVRGSDGSILGEMVVAAQQSTTWYDSYGQLGIEQYPRSLTPYSILWYCMDGGDYSFCDNVSTGATVTAQSCAGARMCKPPPKKKPGEFPSSQQNQ